MLWIHPYPALLLRGLVGVKVEIPSRFTIKQTGGIPLFTSSLTFNAGETIVLKNEYNQLINKWTWIEDTNSYMFQYILETGQYWKGNIESIIIKFYIEKDLNSENFTWFTSTLNDKYYTELVKYKYYDDETIENKCI